MSNSRCELGDRLSKQIVLISRIVLWDLAKANMVKDLICGIELDYGGYKISRNIEHYLTELEAETAKVLASSNQ